MSDRNYTSSIMFPVDTARVGVPYNAALNPATTGSFTVIYWLNVINPALNVLPRHWEQGAHYSCLMGDATNGKYRKHATEVWNGTTALEIWADEIRLESHRWYHIISTFYQGNGTVGTYEAHTYINGKEQLIDFIEPGGAWLGPLHSNGTEAFSIGEGGGNSRGAGAIMHDLIFLNGTISKTQAKEVYYLGSVPTTGLVARWKMNENTGNNVADSSGNGYNGTATGTQVWTTNTPFKARTTVV